MKVGIILPGFSASEQDWCIPALLDLARFLSAQPNLEPHIFPLRYPHNSRPYRVYGATVHPLGGAEVRGVARLSLLTRAVGAVRREHGRSRFDLLHAYWSDEPGLVATIAAKLVRVPAIVSLAGGELARLDDVGYGGQQNRANRLMTSVALRRADRVTAGSRFLLEIAQRHVSAGRLVEASLGVDTSRFSPKPAQEEETTPSDEFVNILHVASLVPVKDQRTLLEALALTVREAHSVRLHLAGDGPLRAELEARAKLPDIAGHVTFHGDVTHDALPALYRMAGFCVQSSRHEAQGMVVLEAGASGRATVGTNVGILPEINCHGTVPIGDAPALARQMVGVARDADLRRRLGDEALRRVREDYALEPASGRLLDLYRDVLLRRCRSQQCSV